MAIRLIIAIACVCGIAFAGPASAGNGQVHGCCACLDEGGMAGCPSSGDVCFTFIGTAENCSAQCAQFGCPAVAATVDAVCGEGSFSGCVVIDPSEAHPAPTLSLGALAVLSLMLLGLQMWRQQRRARSRRT